MAKKRATDRKLNAAERTALVSAFAHVYTVAIYLDQDPAEPLPEDFFNDPEVAALFCKLEGARTYGSVFAEVKELIQRTLARLDGGACGMRFIPSKN